MGFTFRSGKWGFPTCGNKCKPFIMTMEMALTKNATLIMYVCMLIKNAFKEPSRDLESAYSPYSHISKVDYANGAEMSSEQRAAVATL